MRFVLHQLRGEQRLFWRSRELAFFTFLLPILFFVLLGSVYGDDEIEGFDGSKYLLAGLLGYGVVATTFAGLAIVVVIRREEGILKRLRATPLPPWAYVAGILGSTLFVYAIECVALLAIGRLMFGVPFPSRVFSLVVALLLGALAFSSMGLAVTALLRSAEGSSAAVNAIYLPMAFLSGSFFSPRSFPGVLEAVANVLPLTYFIRLVRDVMLRGNEIWDEGTAVAVVAAWGLAGVVGAARGFRWTPREG